MADRPTPYNTGLRDVVRELIIKLARQLSAQSPSPYQQALNLQPAPPDCAPSAVTPWNLPYGTGYRQDRDQAELTREAMAFAEIAQRFPTIFAASSPNTADLGVPNREHEEVGALVQFLAAWLTRRAGTAPGPGPQLPSAGRLRRGR